MGAHKASTHASDLTDTAERQEGKACPRAGRTSCPSSCRAPACWEAWSGSCTAGAAAGCQSRPAWPRPSCTLARQTPGAGHRPRTRAWSHPLVSYTQSLSAHHIAGQLHGPEACLKCIISSKCWPWPAQLSICSESMGVPAPEAQRLRLSSAVCQAIHVALQFKLGHACAQAVHVRWQAATHRQIV